MDLTRLAQLRVAFRLGGEDHLQLMRIGADRLDAEIHRMFDVRGPGEVLAQTLLEGRDAPALP